MIRYPPLLPPPLRDGYGFEPVSPLVRTTMASGRVMQRRRFRSVPTYASVSWILTARQARYFEAWFEYTLKSGSLWFICPLSSPMGFQDQVARFADIYSGPVLVGVNCWRFTAQLELPKRPLYDEDWFTVAPDYLDNANVVDLAMNKKWPLES